MIDRIGKKLNQIHFTLDSHHEVDIAHPIFWTNSEGKHPGVFTIITHKDVESGVWRPTLMAYKDWTLFYTAELEKNGRYPLCIWPPHCRIAHTEKRKVLDANGKETNASYDFCGYGIFEPIASALSRWCSTKVRTINFVF